MRRLRLLGFIVLALLSLAGLAASAASATEAGLLPLVALKEAIKFKGTSGLGTLKTANGIETVCTSDKNSGTLGAAGQTHITTGTVTLDIEGCKTKKGATEAKCQSENAKGEKDPNGTVLVEMSLKSINVLKESTLEPGVALTILNPPLKVVCGVLLKIELKGSVLGLLLATSLTADVTGFSLDFLFAGETCDKGEKACEELNTTANLLLVNSTGTFEHEELEIKDEATLEGAEVMVLVDD